jgi:F-type H+-transporting ATPase subunit b
MGLITPNPGLLFWTLLAFSSVLWILWKYAYGPILSSLKDREDFIAQALNSADEARNQMSQLQNENEKLLVDAREERDQILRQAREMRDTVVEEARKKASEEANRIVENARMLIQNERKAAVSDLKAQIGRLSIEIAEKVLQEELKDKSKQNAMIDKQLENIRFN